MGLFKEVDFLYKNEDMHGHVFGVNGFVMSEVTIAKLKKWCVSYFP
jgi:hypothetical protein